MKLSKLERVLLINQYKILKHLEKTDEYDELLTVLREGYEIHYYSAFSHLAAGVPEADCDFVLNVLQMYRAIEAYKRDNADSEIAVHPWSHFLGFDGNNEGGLCAFARFEIDSDHKWDEHKRYAAVTDRFNSHSEMRPAYERMVAAWKRLGEPFPLSKAHVTAILDAASRRDASRPV